MMSIFDPRFDLTNSKFLFWANSILRKDSASPDKWPNREQMKTLLEEALGEKVSEELFDTAVRAVQFERAYQWLEMTFYPCRWAGYGFTA